MKSVTLSKTAWHVRLMTWAWNEDPKTTNYCPYFWQLVTTILLLPAICVMKGINRFADSAFNTFDNCFTVDHQQLAYDHAKTMWAQGEYHWVFKLANGFNGADRRLAKELGWPTDSSGYSHWIRANIKQVAIDVKWEPTNARYNGRQTTADLLLEDDWHCFYYLKRDMPYDGSDEKWATIASDKVNERTKRHEKVVIVLAIPVVLIVTITAPQAVGLTLLAVLACVTLAAVAITLGVISWFIFTFAKAKYHQLCPGINWVE